MADSRPADEPLTFVAQSPDPAAPLPIAGLNIRQSFSDDLIAQESLRQLVESTGGRSFTEVLPAQAPVLPSLAEGGATGSAEMVQRVAANRLSQRSLFGGDRSDPDPVSKYHTLLPRLMVIAALIAGLGVPLLLVVLQRQGHLEIDGSTLTFDERGESVITAAITAIVACSVLGWLWWAVAAALNARKQARYSVSPLLAPIALAVMLACAFALRRVLDQDPVGDSEETKQLLITVGLVAVAVIAHFGTMTAYRRTAGVIGASTLPWFIVIVLPWAALGLNLLAQFFINAVGDSFLTVSAVTNLAFIGVQVLAIYQAMTSFDQACVGRQMAHEDRGELPAFMRTAR